MATSDLTVLLLAAAAISGAVDWWAVATGRHAVRLVAKPLTMALLVAVAAVVGDPPGEVRIGLVVGAVLGLAGDVALLGNGERAFMAGLGSFAAGHLAYAGAALGRGFDVAWSMIGLAVMAVLLACRFATRTVPGAREQGGAVLAGAVMFYAVVITVMTTATWGTGIVVAGLGATAFALSDWALGYLRFVGPLRHGGLRVIVPYHVGQALLIVGLAAG